MYEDVIALSLHVRMEVMFHYVQRTHSRLGRELGRERRRLEPRRTEAELIEAAQMIARGEAPS